MLSFSGRRKLGGRTDKFFTLTSSYIAATSVTTCSVSLHWNALVGANSSGEAGLIRFALTALTVCGLEIIATTPG